MPARKTGRTGRSATPGHKQILEVPYETWVEAYGEQCGICGAERKRRRLDRDHDHATGEARGLLCVRCNRALPRWMDAGWLRLAADYLARERVDLEELYERSTDCCS